MYSFIKGYVESIEGGLIVINCGNIGYEIHASTTTISKLGSSTEMVKVFTHLNVREDEMSLFGFATKEEKELFLLLVSVSGIGCKMALGVLSAMSYDKLIIAISGGDIKTLSSAKGVGKKTAERIVVELKDKMSAIGSVGGLSLDISDSAAGGESYNDAIAILISLGFSKTEANAAVLKASKTTTNTDKIIELVLKGS